VTQGFDRTDDRRYSVTLDEVERGLITSLAHQVLDLVTPTHSPSSDDPLAAIVGSMDEPVAAPDDAALIRLFPDAYRDDPEAAQDFRRFTEHDLRLEKCARARSVQESVVTEEEGHATFVFDEGSALVWLGFLNDVRLILGTRLGITDDWQEGLETMSVSDPRIGLFHLYDWLTYIQETLIQSLTGD
jgi:hypothetical protein